MAEAPVKIKPDTIVLIHGFWVTPRSWEHWKKYYEAKGYTVLTPAYPGFEIEVEALRADPTPIEQLQVSEIIEMLENLIGKLDRQPIISGTRLAASSPRSCSITASVRWSTSERMSAVDRTETAVSVVSSAMTSVAAPKKICMLA